MRRLRIAGCAVTRYKNRNIQYTKQTGSIALRSGRDLRPAFPALWSTGDCFVEHNPDGSSSITPANTNPSDPKLEHVGITKKEAQG